MNEGPFRMPNAADKGATSRPAAASHSPAEEPKVPAEEPKPVHHRPTSTSSRRPVKVEKPKKQFILIGAAVAAVVVIALIVWALLPHKSNNSLAIDSSKYQAVSLADGQLYFGKLSQLNDEYMKLTDVYYLQPQTEDGANTDNLQKSTTNQNFKLVKFTDVIYGPEDEMTIAKTQVLFYENIKANGKVAQLIAQYKKSH